MHYNDTRLMRFLALIVENVTNNSKAISQIRLGGNYGKKTIVNRTFSFLAIHHAHIKCMRYRYDISRYHECR